MYKTQFHYELSMNTKRFTTAEPMEYDLSLKPLPSYMKKVLLFAAIITIGLTTTAISYASPATIKTSATYTDCCIH